MGPHPAAGPGDDDDDVDEQATDDENGEDVKLRTSKQHKTGRT